MTTIVKTIVQENTPKTLTFSELAKSFSISFDEDITNLVIYPDGSIFTPIVTGLRRIQFPYHDEGLLSNWVYGAFSDRVIDEIIYTAERLLDDQIDDNCYYDDYIDDEELEDSELTYEEVARFLNLNMTHLLSKEEIQIFHNNYDRIIDSLLEK